VADTLYQVGDVVPLQATFRTAAGSLSDTTVAMEVRSPSGVVTTPTATRASLGVYTYNLTITEPGIWWYAFIGTGAVAATEQGSLVAETRETSSPTLSAKALVTLDAAREYVFGSITDDSNDKKLIRRINRVSLEIATYTKREWLPIATAATRRFYYPGYGMLHLSPYDLRAITTVTAFTDYPTSYQAVLLAGTTTTVGDYSLRPADPLTATYRWLEFGNVTPLNMPLSPPYTSYRNLDSGILGFQVTILGDWGIGTVPADVEDAALIAIKNSYENPEGAATRQIGPLNYAEPVENLFPGEQWRALPAEARALLAPYREETVTVA
jgi:hypothetical protein